MGPDFGQFPDLMESGIGIITRQSESTGFAPAWLVIDDVRRRESDPFDFGMSGLSALFSALLWDRRSGFAFGEIGRRWFMGIGGSLLESREQLGDGGFELLGPGFVEIEDDAQCFPYIFGDAVPQDIRNRLSRRHADKFAEILESARRKTVQVRERLPPLFSQLLLAERIRRHRVPPSRRGISIDLQVLIRDDRDPEREQ